MPPIRLAYMVSHPIQYQSPLLRRIAAEPDISLKVFYSTDFCCKTYQDPWFNTQITWDIPLRDGFESEVLPQLGRSTEISFFSPFNTGLRQRLKDGRFDWLWLHGYARFAHWRAAVIAKSLGIQVMVRDDVSSISKPRGPLKKVVRRGFFQTLGAVVDRVLTIGSLNEAHYVEQGIPTEKLVRVPYAVDNAFFRAPEAKQQGKALRSTLDIPAEAPIILTASRLVPNKNIDQLIRAFQALAPSNESWLVIVGEGEQRAELENLAAGHPRIRFAGFRNQTELRGFFAACDIFVLASTQEPWGLVVNEVMNLGKPLVLSDQVGCAPDLLRHGDNGLLYPAGDVPQLAEALEALLSDTRQRERMGRRSAEIVSAWDFEADVTGIRQALGLRSSTKL